MAKTDVYRDSDAGYLGSADMHPETWRTYGNNAQMVDMSEHGPLSPAADDGGSTCVKAAGSGEPGFQGNRCASGSLSGASDGARASRRSAARLAHHRENAGEDIEDPDGTGRRIV